MGAAPLDDLAEALALAERLEERVADEALAHVRWTPPQMALLTCTARIVLLRTGNQFGKTWAALAEAIWRCLGAHPFKTVPRAPIRAFLITTSWAQSLEIQTKLWRLVPKDQIAPDVVFDEVKGFRGRIPALKFRNGSVLFIKTSRQGGLSLAGGTVHLIIIDEPPSSPRVFAELQKRVMRTGGHIVMSMTPINAPTDYLRELADRGQIEDLHFRMTPENFVPVGETEPLTLDDGTPMDAAWCKAERARALSWEEPVVCDGEWNFRPQGAAFERFNPRRDGGHVVEGLARRLPQLVTQGKPLKLAIGLDYGEDRLRTAGILIAVEEGERQRVFVLGEYVPQVATTTAMDAAGVLELLTRHGLGWEALAFAHGDKRYTDAKGKLTIKSNKLMLDAIAKAAGSRKVLKPTIRSAKRGPGAGQGAVYASLKWFHERMIEPGGFYIDASCSWLIECIQKWDRAEDSIYKDAIDGMFYAARPWAIRRILATTRPAAIHRG